MGAFFSKLIEFCSASTQMNDDLQNVHTEIQEESSLDTVAAVGSDNEIESISDITDEDNILLVEEEEEEEEQNTDAIFTLSNEKKALVIGINYITDQFDNNDLNGCVNDMNNITSFLRDKCVFLTDDITTLCNSEASRENIENELTNLVVFSHQNPGSVIWLSYSGHGSNMNSYTEEDSKSEVICPSDYATNGIITDSWIQTNFVQGLEKTTKVFVLMDCCNSGSNLNLPYRYKFGDVISNDSSYTVDELVNLCNIIKISGCEDDQTSADYFERKDNEFQGALTNGFLHYPNGGDKDIIHFYNNILSYLISRGFTQRPVLSFSNGKMMNSKLF